MAIKIKGSPVIDNNENLTIDGNAVVQGNLNVEGTTNYVKGDITLGTNSSSVTKVVGDLDLDDGQLLNVRELEFYDYDDNTEHPVVRLLRRDNNLSVYNGGLVVGSYDDGVLGEIGSGNLHVKGKLTFEDGGVDFGSEYPCFRKTLDTGMNFGGSNATPGHTANTWETIKWDSNYHRGFDVGNNFNEGTGKFTAPVSGIYEFHFQVVLDGQDEGSAWARFKFVHDAADGTDRGRHMTVWNCAELFMIGYHSGGTNYRQTGDHTATGSLMSNMTAGDTMHIDIKVNDPGDGLGDVRIDVSDDSCYLNWFQGKLITQTTS